MSRKVKIVTFSFNPASLKDKPQTQSVVDYEIEWLDTLSYMRQSLLIQNSISF